jgi:phosphatidylserine/phosphatidylglycerophosphate/cardiolipin synthase-like enzyme
MRLAVCLLLICLAGSSSAADAPAPPIDVYFSPKGGCTEAILKEIAGAKTSVLVLAYSFTSAPIAAALRDAHRRGVAVDVILDKWRRAWKVGPAGGRAKTGPPGSEE